MIEELIELTLDAENLTIEKLDEFRKKYNITLDNVGDVKEDKVE